MSECRARHRPDAISGGADLVAGFGQGAVQGFDLVSPDPSEEVQQSFVAYSAIGELVQGVDHQTGNQLVTILSRCVLVGSIVADL